MVFFAKSKEYAFADDKEIISFERKIFSKATMDDIFEDNSILVVLDKNVGGINRKIDYTLFNSFEYIDIIDLTHMEGNLENEFLDRENFHQILKVNFSYHSKRFVLNAIKKIEEIPGIR